MRQSSPNRIVLIGIISVALALIIGVGLGLLFSRGAKSLGSADKTIANLSVDAKEEYIVLVGIAYVRDHDLERARAQLDPLGAPNIQQWVAGLAVRYLADGRDETDIRALAELARGLGSVNSQVLAFLATLTPQAPTPAPTITPAPPTAEPTAAPPTNTPQPTDTPLPPSDTATVTDTPAPSDTPIPPTQPTDTPQPQPTNTPKPQSTPTKTPAAKWTWSARLVGPGEEGQECDGGGKKMVRVTVLDANGAQIPGVWVYEQYTDQYRVTGHKGDDPFWGPGEAEYSGLEGGLVCIATGEGGACESDFTRNLPCHDSVPVDDLWAAGYCECWEAGITKEQCQQKFDSGEWLKIGWYYWRVEFRRSY